MQHRRKGITMTIAIALIAVNAPQDCAMQMLVRPHVLCPKPLGSIKTPVIVHLLMSVALACAKVINASRVA
jgi:hypothetical protein